MRLAFVSMLIHQWENGFSINRGACYTLYLIAVAVVRRSIVVKRKQPLEHRFSWKGAMLKEYWRKKLLYKKNCLTKFIVTYQCSNRYWSTKDRLVSVTDVTAINKTIKISSLTANRHKYSQPIISGQPHTKWKGVLDTIFIIPICAQIHIIQYWQTFGSITSICVQKEILN